MSDDQLFATSIRANCGCGWHPIATKNGIAPTTVSEVVVKYHSDAVAHASATGHAVELFTTISPLFTVAGGNGDDSA